GGSGGSAGKSFGNGTRPTGTGPGNAPAAVLPNTGTNDPLYVLLGIVMLVTGSLVVRPIRRMLRSWQ
ncbi:MAG: LPXTG cell wall anchor domain-containing protein, partial [Kyrpidia sp.]|nr:LPXTG cell wall anchor domain-containing protein [Kyrpidia sp.]